MSPAAKSAPRRRLDHEQVVAAAEEIVDELGWDRLTMAALATRVGTKGPSLYNHVASLEDLKRELQERTIRMIGRELVVATMGRAGRDSFLELARTYRDFVRRYPERYLGMTRMPIVDQAAFAVAARDANEALLAVVRSYGVPEEHLLLAQLATFAALHGALSLEVSGFLGDVIDPAQIFDTLVDSTEQRLAALHRDQVA